ncbi:PilZ domain-containing protein [Sphingomonas sp. GCM10030256]|uniref:PilZ domain-containing protein n=1 Tax=Sphingomonas sp. GCM10030256 TaxID=3273427 RepID=UPI00361F9870
MNELPVEATLYSLSKDPPAPPERREGGRHLTLFRVGSLIIGDLRELCLIKNVSSGGMKLRVYRALKPDQPIGVEMKCGERLDGRVSWVRDHQVGLAFDQPIDVAALLAQGEGDPRPRMPRIETRATVVVREGAFPYRMRACDISQGGIKVECNQPLEAGTDVVVSLAGLEPQPGVVRWSESGLAGITFNRLLPLPVLIGWLQAQSSQRAA